VIAMQQLSHATPWTIQYAMELKWDIWLLSVLSAEPGVVFNSQNTC